jgi:hypothetical protein
MAPLDFGRVKEFLLKNARNPSLELEICSTLQAMSWRITKVSSKIRRQNLHSYQHYDIIDVKAAQNPNSVFQQMIGEKTRQRVKDFFIIFVNSLASEYIGRCYLLQRKDMVNMLISILFNEGNQDNSLRQNSLGSLQKFSLRRDAQSIMISQDVINWILTTLKNEGDTLSEYSLEYTTALLMNLSLRVAGKNKCE